MAKETIEVLTCDRLCGVREVSNQTPAQRGHEATSRNCFGIPDTYRGLRIKQGPDDRFSAHRIGEDAHFEADTWEELQDLIDGEIYDRLSSVRKAHALDPRHPYDCECHPCWLVKEKG